MREGGVRIEQVAWELLQSTHSLSLQGRLEYILFESFQMKDAAGYNLSLLKLAFWYIL